MASMGKLGEMNAPSLGRLAGQGSCRNVTSVGIHGSLSGRAAFEEGLGGNHQTAKQEKENSSRCGREGTGGE